MGVIKRATPEWAVACAEAAFAGDHELVFVLTEAHVNKPADVMAVLDYMRRKRGWSQDEMADFVHEFLQRWESEKRGTLH